MSGSIFSTVIRLEPYILIAAVRVRDQCARGVCNVERAQRLGVCGKLNAVDIARLTSSAAGCGFTAAIFFRSSALVRGAAAVSTASRTGPSSSTNEGLLLRLSTTSFGKSLNFATRLSSTIDDALLKSYDPGSYFLGGGGRNGFPYACGRIPPQSHTRKFRSSL